MLFPRAVIAARRFVASDDQRGHRHQSIEKSRQWRIGRHLRQFQMELAAQADRRAAFATLMVLALALYQLP
ncbi:hypothetical protein D3C72_2486000 [compost metagenome]